MSKMIEIKIANPNSIRIHFTMTRSCTYTCAYCPESLHAGKHRDINLQDLETFLLRFSDRSGAVNITGGECTTHPQFKEVVETIKKTGFKVMVDSNGVRTLRFYDEVKDLVDNWCITLHPSQHTLDLEKLKLLARSSFLVVYVMMDPAYWDTALDWYKQVSELKDLKVTPARVMDDWGGADYSANYTHEQLDILAKLESKWLFTDERFDALHKTHMWLYDTEAMIFYDDGSSSKMDTFEVIRRKENNFEGWKCSAGKETICIYDDGTATWANCGIKRFNHFLDINPKELEEPVICTYKECTCGSDIRGTKER